MAFDRRSKEYASEGVSNLHCDRGRQALQRPISDWLTSSYPAMVRLTMKFPYTEMSRSWAILSVVPVSWLGKGLKEFPLF